MKAQSAIEYLTTYGWMLITVAVMAGAIYPLIDSGCMETSSGFQQGPIMIEDSGLDSNGNLDLVIRNSRSRELEVQEIVAKVNDRERTYSISENISAGQEDVSALKAFERSDACEQVELELIYSIGSLDGLSAKGEVVGEFSFNNQSLPQPLDAVNVNY